MSIELNISFDGVFSSLNKRKRKKIDRLQKSVYSLNAECGNFSTEWYDTNQNFTFSHEEINSAIKRLEKDENEFRHPLPDIDVYKFVKYQSHYSQRYIGSNESFVVGLFKAIFGFVVPGVHFDARYANYETGADWADIHMSEDLKAELLAEMYYRRTTRILSNILSKFFEFRKLITAESPIKTIRYKYFDLVFSLKKDVVLKSMLITQFFRHHFYLRDYEKKDIGYIQAAGRT